MRRKTTIDEWQANSALDAGNAAWLEAAYERFLTEPNALAPEWREYFATLSVDGMVETRHSDVREQFRARALSRRGGVCPPSINQALMEHERAQVQVLQLINSYRFLGHRRARVNPLSNFAPLENIPELTLAYHGLSDADLKRRFKTGSLAGPDEARLDEILETLEQTYCGSIGVQYMHITETAEKRWLQQRFERVRSTPQFAQGQRLNILGRLTAAETLERYLHTRYVGQKRFSLEGGESLIPLLDEVIQRGGEQGLREVVIGMAHRGRLNVLINVIGKTAQELFDEFEGKVRKHNGTGDVKYHQGYSSDVMSPGGPVHLVLAFNPSHLEIVNPVVEGSVRARQDRRGDKRGEQVMPILIHGDAAVAGQGVVMETLNMAQTRGFSTKGTLHVVVNNQIGFTTSVQGDARSTQYCSDVMKMVNAPIFHVNGDDPEAVVLAAQIALDYRMTFNKDVMLDLVCYRRQGHNEADEPGATQPMMYQAIRALATTRTLYADYLITQEMLSSEEAHELVADCRARLETGDCVVPHQMTTDQVSHEFGVDWRAYLDQAWLQACDTGVDVAQLQALAARLQQLPTDFTLHPRVEKIRQARQKMASGAQALDWGFAEILAYATLTEDGYQVRLSGQDSGRGTFFHRHAVLHHQQHCEAFVPLRCLQPEKRFLVIDSLLSEEAVLGFEYGYATASPETLVIWEAQFGDFANGAQVVIDQFISSGEQKWNRLCGLVMLLPHGYEGQGPEHSSARLERYLQLCAQHNMQVCVPSTPAQIFHLLRRQMRRAFRKPLIVMSPKSLLRHKRAVSRLEELSNGQFQNVIPETASLDADQVQRVVICSGKVYYDLFDAREAAQKMDVALIRLEQLYPFPDEEFSRALAQFPLASSVVWCQEEPLNQGAWYSSQHHFQRLLAQDVTLFPVSRPASASPAVGYRDVHLAQQQQLVALALGLEVGE